MPPKSCPVCGATDATCAPAPASGASVTVTIAGQEQANEHIEAEAHEKARTAKNKARKVAANK